ncbi:MAG: hypothetical protein OHK0015_33430 [Chloroflexi bacterium OHK40]
MLQPETLLNDRYRVVALIGQGGMGAVYQAIDERLRNPVALKQTMVSGTMLSRAFEREAQILAGLRHPSLPRVIDHFVTPEGQFLVMEFIPGPDLAAALAARSAPFPLAEVLTWADQLLDALDYLHRQQPPVIHRDIKPQNLKLTPQGQIVLLDFGLAKGSAALPTRASSESPSLFGYTPQYAPLEQIQGTGTGPGSDLYSLGASLYHLATGQPPADTLTRAQARLNGLPDPLRPADALNPAISPPVSAVLTQAMALRTGERFGSAQAMRRALQLAAANAPAVQAATGPTVVARHPPTPEVAPRRADPPPAPPEPPRQEPLAIPRAVPGPERRGPPLALTCLGMAALLVLLASAGAWMLLGDRVSSGLGDIRPGLSPTAPSAPTADLREATPIAVREEVLRLEGAIDAPGQQVAYRFDAAANAQIFVQTAAYDPGMEQIELRLLDANGDEVASTCLGCGNLGVQTLRQGGTYTLIVGDDTDPATGVYELRLNLVPESASFPIALDARISAGSPAPGAGLISLPGAKQRYTFDAAANDQIFVQTAAYDPGMEQIELRLLDANGDEVASTCLGCGNLGVQTLRQGGPYTLEVGDDSDPPTGAYEVRVSAVPPPEAFDVALPFQVGMDQPATGAGQISKPGAVQRYSFEASPGAQMFVTTIRYDAGMEQIELRLLDGNGGIVAEQCLGCGNLGAQVLRQGGRYTIQVGDTSDPATGAYELEVTLVP